MTEQSAEIVVPPIPTICIGCGHPDPTGLHILGCADAQRKMNEPVRFTPVEARPRVSFTPGSIQGVLTARKRHVCQNHLDTERHYIEPGDRYVANALPPDHPDIGNPGWWHLRVCLDCCPVEHDERRTSPD